MKNAFLVGVSAIAITLGGCSMFQRGESGAASSSQQNYQTAAPSAPLQTPSAMQGGIGGSSASPDRSSSMSNDMNAASGPMHKSQSTSSEMRGSAHAAQVREAQQKLKDEGEYTGEVDGKFGHMTAQAVKQFQQKNGLKQTGRLDRETIEKLGVGSTAGSGSSTAPDNPSKSDGASGTMGNKPAGGSL